MCADGGELLKVIGTKHLHEDMQPTSIKTKWRTEKLFNERFPGFLETK